MARISWIVAGSLVAAMTIFGAAEAKDSMLATIDQPATLTAGPASPAMLGAADIGSRHVLLTVVAFTPPPDEKPVEVVVWAARNGSDAFQKIGNFALTPYVAFTAQTPSMAQRFQLPLPTDLADQKKVSLRVELVPVDAGGQGARLEIGAAAIQ